MAAIYMWPEDKYLLLTTTPYPVEMVERIVFGINVDAMSMKPIAQEHFSNDFSAGPDGSLIQKRWFWTDGPYFDEFASEFGVGPDGTLIQLRWFWEDGPYLDEFTNTFGVLDGTLILTRIIVEADTGSSGKPYEELQLNCRINDTCTMDLI